MNNHVKRWLGVAFILFMIYKIHRLTDLFHDRYRFSQSKYKGSLEELEAKEEDLRRVNNELREEVARVYESLKEFEIRKKNKSVTVPRPQVQPTKSNLIGNTAKQSTTEELLIPIVVLACNRITVNRALDSILIARKNLNPAEHPIVVSQDCGHQATRGVIQTYEKETDFIWSIEQPDLSDFKDVKKAMQGYFKLSRHYKFALDKVFQRYPKAAGVIIVEDDLLVSPDFISYFRKFTPMLLDPAENLYCVSAWNDNGKLDQIEQNPGLVYRTDFFGGLGWMLSAQIWNNEWTSKWPQAFWDDWVRNVDQRQGRQCIHPEVPRTSTFGKVGVSGGQFFDKYLGKIHEFTGAFDWDSFDVETLKETTFNKEFFQRLADLPIATYNDLSYSLSSDVKIIYEEKRNFVAIATKIGIMQDLKAGVPRMGYHGVVSAIYKGRRVYVSPPDPSTWEYKTNW